MKKITCIAIVVLISLSLIGCGNQISANSGSNKTMEDEISTSPNTINYSILKEADYIASRPEDLYEISDLVIQGKFVSNLDTIVADNSLPVTISGFKVDQVYKGDVSKEIIDVSYYGGTVSLDEYLKTLTSEQIKKHNIDCTDDELSTATVSYQKTDESVNVNFDDTYVLFLSCDKEREINFILCDGYGVCKVVNEKLYTIDGNSYIAMDFLEK